MDHDSNDMAVASIHSRLLKLSKVQPHPSIYKVHRHLRSINDKAYEPQIISIGPYHRGRDNLQMMEDHKLRYFRSLLQRKGQNVDLYISAIGELEERARRCYSEPIGLNASEFVEMLVLDGCFIIEFLRKSNEKSGVCHNFFRNIDPIFRISWIADSLHRDFILFENQIPFFVLCKLFDLIEEAHNELNDVVLFFSKVLPVGSVKRPNREIKHLLHLIHNNWRPDHSFIGDDDVRIEVDSICIRALCCLNKRPSTSATEFGFKNIPSATELTKANVSFSKGKPDDNIFRVDFKKGVLVMQQLTVGDNTECIFRNLIAYEQYFPDELHGNNFVTDYVKFMDRLINTPRDVEILSEKGIINNCMGSNEVVAGIFNQLNDSVSVPSGTFFTYSEVVDRVFKHYERPWNRAVAVLRRDYFNSPWAAIAFFSAVLLLVLTVAQTVCSLLQL